MDTELVKFLVSTMLTCFDSKRAGKCFRGSQCHASCWMLHSKFNCKARGAAILIHKSIPFIVSEVKSDPNGWYVIVTSSLFNTPLTLANVYAPNWDDSNLFKTFLHSRRYEYHYGPSLRLFFYKIYSAFKVLLGFTVIFRDIWSCWSLAISTSLKRQYSFFSPIVKPIRVLIIFLLILHCFQMLKHAHTIAL